MKLLFMTIVAGIIVALGGCGDNKEELFITDTFEGTENEVVAFELENIPGYVSQDLKGYVSIYYSKYVDEYFEDDIHTHEIESDIQEYRIGVELAEFYTYGIPFHSKVYVSASVTNRGRKVDGDGLDWGFGGYPVQRKAYLKELKLRD